MLSKSLQKAFKKGEKKKTYISRIIGRKNLLHVMITESWECRRGMFLICAVDEYVHVAGDVVLRATHTNRDNYSYKKGLITG